jgi:putative NADPH-quinone reductase
VLLCQGTFPWVNGWQTRRFDRRVCGRTRILGGIGCVESIEGRGEVFLITSFVCARGSISANRTLSFIPWRDDMNILVVLAHPNPESFNHAIAHAAVGSLRSAGHDVIFHDLCEEQFPSSITAEEIPSDAATPPVIQQHCRELREADGIIVVHPNWWGQPPAVLKGWIDRVIRPGVAYRFEETDQGEGVPVGLLRARAAMVFNTSNTPAEREQAVFHDPLETIWKNCVFDLCGVKTFFRRMFGVVVASSPTQRAQWLEEVRESVTSYFPATDG